MPHVNVYLSTDLRADMDAIEGVNWSEVAQHAFRAAIEDHQQDLYKATLMYGGPWIPTPRKGGRPRQRAKNS